MGKKHKHPEHENLERWLVSYADFITLLFATFVVLYAIGQADLAKFKQLSQSFKQAFNPASSVMQNPGGIMKGTPNAGLLQSTGNSMMDKVMPKMPASVQQEGEVVKEMMAVVQQVNEQIAKATQATTATEKSAHAAQSGEKPPSPAEQAKLLVQERGAVIRMAGNLFFEPGAATLKPSAYAMLDRIAAGLKSGSETVHVEGHTDDHDLSSAAYPSNWELSSARASSVVRYLIQKHGFSPKRLAAVGYAHTRPVANNQTATGRRQNRRVDIVVLFEPTAKHADAGEAQKNQTTLDPQDKTVQEAFDKIPSRVKGVAAIHEHSRDPGSGGDQTRETVHPYDPPVTVLPTPPREKPAPPSQKSVVEPINIRPDFSDVWQSKPQEKAPLPAEPTRKRPRVY